MKMKGKYKRPKCLSEILEKWRKRHLGRPRFGKKNGQAGRGPDMAQKVFRICEAKNGTETDELLQAGTDGYPRYGKMLKRIQVLRCSTWKKVKVLKVEIEELESLLGPGDIEVDFRRILEEARDRKGCAIFETFSTDGPSGLLMVSRSRWDKHQRRLTPWRQISSASSCERHCQEGLEGQRVGWSSLERRVMGAVENDLENCVLTKVDIEALERLMEPENEEVSLRYILKSTRRKDAVIFCSREKGPFRGKQKTMVGESGKEGNKAITLAKVVA